MDGGSSASVAATLGIVCTPMQPMEMVLPVRTSATLVGDGSSSVGRHDFDYVGQTAVNPCLQNGLIRVDMFCNYQGFQCPTWNEDFWQHKSNNPLSAPQQHRFVLPVVQQQGNAGYGKQGFRCPAPNKFQRYKLYGPAAP